MDHQDRTIKTYQDNFDIYKQKTSEIMSEEFKVWMDTFINYLPVGCKIFEFGSAQGREAKYLREKGFQVFCTDIIPEAIEELKNDGFDAEYFDFRGEIKDEWVGMYDAVLAKAVFLHATQDIFEKIIDKIKKLLKKRGVICLTFKNGNGEEIETKKLGGERYFKYYTEKDLREIFSKHEDLEILQIDKGFYENSDWLQIILKKK